MFLSLSPPPQRGVSLSETRRVSLSLSAGVSLSPSPSLMSAASGVERCQSGTETPGGSLSLSASIPLQSGVERPVSQSLGRDTRPGQISLSLSASIPLPGWRGRCLSLVSAETPGRARSLSLSLCLYPASGVDRPVSLSETPGRTRSRSLSVSAETSGAGVFSLSLSHMLADDTDHTSYNWKKRRANSKNATALS